MRNFARCSILLIPESAASATVTVIAAWPANGRPSFGASSAMAKYAARGVWSCTLMKSTPRALRSLTASRASSALASAEEARAAVRDLKARGVDFIKVHDHTPRAAYFAIAEEAPKLGLPFAGHAAITVTVAEAADSGIKSIEHLAKFRIFTE